MKTMMFDERVRLAIELAMTADAQDAALHRQQEARARALAMSGAEIDAARQGWSFDVQTSAALALAIASADHQRRAAQHQRALAAGIAEPVCRDIETLAQRFSDRPLSVHAGK